MSDNLKPENTLSKKLIYSLLTFFEFFTDRKPVPFGMNFYNIDYSIPQEKGEILFEKSKILAKYIITRSKKVKDDSDDFIIYFHGAGLNEYQWIFNNGFGRQFYDAADINPLFNVSTVVSVSFGMSYLMIDGLPYPFKADMQQIFINEFIPHIRSKLNKNGKIFLAGYSLGAFNAMLLAFRHPEIFPAILLLSPFISVYSPFKEIFILKNSDALGLNWWAYMLRDMLVYSFGSEEKWLEYSPYDYIKGLSSFVLPKIIITKTKREPEGFAENVDLFIEMLKNRNIDYSYFTAAGNHHNSTAPEAFNKFIVVIMNIKN